MQSATFASQNTFMQEVWMLLRRLRAEQDGLFELHVIAVFETIHWRRTADWGNYVRYVPACMKGLAALQLKQPKLYKCLVFDRYDSEMSIKQLERNHCFEEINESIWHATAMHCFQTVSSNCRTKGSLQHIPDDVWTRYWGQANYRQAWRG